MVIDQAVLYTGPFSPRRPFYIALQMSHLLSLDNAEHVISEYSELPKDASDEGIQFRRSVLKLCLLGMELGRKSVSLCSEGHSSHGSYLQI